MKDYCYLFIVKQGFFTTLRFKVKKFVIFKLIGPHFCGKLLFRGKCIAIEIYANLGLAQLGFKLLGPGV